VSEHTCGVGNWGDPGRRCFACEEEKAAAGLKLSPDDVLDVYVPGRLRCPTCNFQLTKATLFVQSGQIGASKAEVYQESEPCPNDGDPMVRVTWREEADANREYAGRLIDELLEATGATSLPAAMEAIKDIRSSDVEPSGTLNEQWQQFAQEFESMRADAPLQFARMAFFAGAQSFCSAMAGALDEQISDKESMRLVDAVYAELAAACEEMKI
jgi:hypothetical protein